jgi:hypothetical protein
MFFSTIEKGDRVFGYFPNALVYLPMDLSVSGFPLDLKYNRESYMALALV